MKLEGTINNSNKTALNAALDGYTQSRFAFLPARAKVWKEFTVYLQKQFSIRGNVLDIGCGYGDFINHVQADRKSALDLNPSMADFLSKEVDFKPGSASDLGKLFGGQKFDWIFSSNLLEHLTRSEINELLQTARKLLNPGGRVAFLIPNYRLASAVYFDDYTHQTPISDRALVDWLVATGYDIEFAHPGFMPYSMKNSKVPAHPLLVRLWLHSPFKPGGKQMLVIGKVRGAK